MYLISKSCRFEAAHRLVAPYVGKCNSMHGHSFLVTMDLAAERLNDCDMVEDFSALKPVKDWIMTNLDHATVVSASDLDLLNWLKAEKQKHFIVDGNPTSETLAKLIFDRAQKIGFALYRVSVSETCTNSATFMPTK